MDLTSLFKVAGTAVGNAKNVANTATGKPTTTKKKTTTKTSAPTYAATKTINNSVSNPIVGYNTGTLNQSNLVNKAMDIGNAAAGVATKAAGIPTNVTAPMQTTTNAVKNNAAKNNVQSPGIPTEYIDQLTALTNQMKALEQKQVPDYSSQINQLIAGLQNTQQAQLPQYQSQYNDEIATLLNQYNSRPAFSFDATNNPTIQAYQKQAADAVTQEMARRNILNSSITGDKSAEKIAEVFATVAPQLQAQAYNQYQDQGASILQQLQNYQNLDSNEYNKYMDNYNIQNQQRQNSLSNTYQLIDLINGLQQQDYAKSQDAINNAMQSSNLTGKYNPYAGITVSPEVQKYSGDYQAEINIRRATPDTSDDALIPQLEAARANKIFSSPDLLNKYGDQFKTAEQKAIDTANALQQAQIEAANNPNSYENQKRSLELQMLAEELKRIQAVDPSFATQEAQLKLAEIQSRINENAASASASYALAQQRKNNPNGMNANGYTETQQKDIDFVDEQETIKRYPDTALQAIKDNKEALIVYYGQSKYNQLLKQAEEAYKKFGSSAPVYRQF